jgi:hypothetical protein
MEKEIFFLGVETLSAVLTICRKLYWEVVISTVKTAFFQVVRNETSIYLWNYLNRR